jgi:glycosyltransferase AglE
MKKVSVIVPVYNNPDGLGKVLESLVNQSYPRELYEIIVVDNGSNDGLTLNTAVEYQNAYNGLLRVLTENSIQGSYAARNTGILHSQGDVIAMIDSDCIPSSKWLENGLLALDALGADLVGGHVKFIYSSRPSSAEMYDSIVHMQIKHAIATNSASPTPNLFVRKVVFNAIGLFPSDLQSGGDIIWTRKATRSGFKLKFAPEAEVLHPARNLNQLIKKRIRVAGAHFAVWRSKNISVLAIIRDMLRYLFPPRIRYIQKLIEERGSPQMNKHIWSIWFVAWACRYATNLGRVQALLRGVRL